MSKLGRIGAALGVSLLVGGLVAGPASAAQDKTLNSLQAKASGATLTLDLLGRHLTLADSSVASSVTSSAKDKSADVLSAVDATANSAAILGSKAVTASLSKALPDPSCVQQLGELTAPITSAGAPVVTGGLACAKASVAGASPVDFTGLANGSITTLNVQAGAVLSQLIANLDPVVQQVMDAGLGQVITAADDTDRQATAALNGLFDQLVGTGNVILPNLNLNQTVGSLLTKLQNADTTLASLDLGEATAKNVGAATTFSAESTNTGGALEILPNVLGIAHNAPLLRIRLGASSASVAWDKAKQGLEGMADNTIVYVESPLLPYLNFNQANVAGVTPFKDLASVLGLQTGQDADGSYFVAVKPGQAVSLFCDTALSALCTSISVGMPTKTELPGGGIREQSSAVSIRTLQNISDLVPGAGTILANSALDAVLPGTTKTTAGGLALDVAGSVAEVSPALIDVTPASHLDTPTTMATTGANPWLAILGAMTLIGFLILRRTVLAAR